MRAGQLTLVALVNGWRRPGLFTQPVMEDKLAEVLTLNLLVRYTACVHSIGCLTTCDTMLTGFAVQTWNVWCFDVKIEESGIAISR